MGDAEAAETGLKTEDSNGSQSDTSEDNGIVFKAKFVNATDVIPTIVQSGPYIVAVDSTQNDLIGHDVIRDTPIGRIEGHKDSVTSLVSLADEVQFVTASTDKTVKIWTVEKDQIVEKDSIEFDEAVMGIAPHPKLKMILVLLTDNVVKLRHIANKEKDEASIEIKDSKVTCICQGEEQIIYGVDNGKVYAWHYENVNFNPSKPSNPCYCLSKHTKPVTCLTTQQKYLCSYAKGEMAVYVWDLTTGTLFTNISIGSLGCTSLCLSDDFKTLVVGRENGCVDIYGMEGGNKLQGYTLDGATTFLTLKDNELMAVTNDGHFQKRKLDLTQVKKSGTCNIL